MSGTDDLSQLATMIADLDSYIERRAAERAAPAIDAARAEAADTVRQADAELTRRADLVAELRRRVKILERGRDQAVRDLAAIYAATSDPAVRALAARHVPIPGAVAFCDEIIHWREVAEGDRVLHAGDLVTVEQKMTDEFGDIELFFTQGGVVTRAANALTARRISA